MYFSTDYNSLNYHVILHSYYIIRYVMKRYKSDIRIKTKDSREIFICRVNYYDDE